MTFRIMVVSCFKGEFMLKKYEVEEIIKDALMELDGMLSPPDYEDGKSTVYGVSIEDDENGDMIFSFKEDYAGEDIDKYRIKIERIKE